MGAAILAVVAFVGGWVVGGLRKFDFMLASQVSEVHGSLNHTVEMLSALRAGETEWATELMEARVTAAVLTLRQGKEWAELPPGLQDTLVVADRYLTAYPPTRFSQALEAMLEWIPDEPLPDTCSPAARRLLAEEQG